MIINHSIPGMGKSTFSKILEEFIPNTVICSTDSYFVENGVYTYDATKIGYFHKLNFENAIKAMDEGKNVIIDNTNVTKKAYALYEHEALKRNYRIFHLYFKPDIDLAKERNIHEVPDNTILNMARLLCKDFNELMPPIPKKSLWSKFKNLFSKKKFLEDTGESSVNNK